MTLHGWEFTDGVGTCWEWDVEGDGEGCVMWIENATANVRGGSDSLITPQVLRGVVAVVLIRAGQKIPP